MYVFQIGFKDGNNNTYYSSGIYARYLMDMFGWDIQHTAHVNETEVRYDDVPGNKLQVIGVARNLQVEELALSLNVNWFDLDEYENVIMMEVLDPWLFEKEASQYYPGGPKYNVAHVMDIIRGLGNMPKGGMPVNDWIKNRVMVRDCC